MPPLTPEEQAVWAIDQTINARGFAVDLTLAQAAHNIAAEEKEDINTRIATLTNGAITTANQNERILKYVRERGHAAKSLNKRSVAQILAHGPDEETRQILELRRAGGRSSVAKFRTAIADADADGRVRDTFRYHGSHTGRWAGRSFQPQNLPKVTIADIDAATDAVRSGDHARVQSLNGGDTLSIISNVVRNVIVAKPGHVLIGADFSAIESRVLAWLAGEQWKVQNYRDFDRTGDPKLEPYCVTATRMLHREVTPADEAGRQHGKNADLALGFGGSVAAWRKFMPNDPRSDEQIKRETVDPWRAAHPAIHKFWGGIDRMFKICTRTGKPATCSKITAEMLDGALRLTLPSGRCLVYREAHLGPGKFEDSTDLHFHNGYRAAQAWFGTIVENIVQGVARDLLACAMVRLEAAGFPVVLHCHDEAVCEVPEDQADEARFLELMTALPDWAEGLPIAAKTWIGKRYGKSKTEKGAPPIVAVTQADLDEINTGLKREGIEPLSIDAEEDLPWHPPTEAPEITRHRPAQAVESLAPATRDREFPLPPPEFNDPPPRSNGHAGNGFDRYAAGEEKPHGNIKAHFVYCTADGQPYLRVTKTTTKKFWQSHWEDGCWKDGAPKGPKILYRLPDLIAAPAAEPVWICEGEKDTDSVARARTDRNHQSRRRRQMVA